MLIDVDPVQVLEAIRLIAPSLRAPMSDPQTQSALAEGLHRGWSGAPAFVASVHAGLRSGGFVVFRVPGMAALPPAQRRAVAVSVSALFGFPTRVAAAQQVVWDVRAAPSSEPSSPRRTDISTAVGEAALHTDSAFAEQPEKYFGLWCLSAARDGGASVLVNAESLFNLVRTLPGGGDALTTMRDLPAPYWDGATCRRLSILGDGIRTPLIRFRRDLVDFSRTAPLPGDTALRSAVELLSQAIMQIPPTQVVMLRRDDAVLIDNHRMLHGRTGFTDPNRHLLRVRINLSPNR